MSAASSVDGCRTGSAGGVVSVRRFVGEPLGCAAGVPGGHVDAGWVVAFVFDAAVVNNRDVALITQDPVYL